MPLKDQMLFIPINKTEMGIHPSYLGNYYSSESGIMNYLMYVTFFLLSFSKMIKELHC